MGEVEEERLVVVVIRYRSAIGGGEVEVPKKNANVVCNNAEDTEFDCNLWRCKGERPKPRARNEKENCGRDMIRMQPTCSKAICIPSHMKRDGFALRSFEAPSVIMVADFGRSFGRFRTAPRIPITNPTSHPDDAHYLKYVVIGLLSARRREHADPRLFTYSLHSGRIF